MLVIDETSFPKRGHHSAGVAMQYCGTSGHVENCQVGVFLSYVTARGHTLIDRELSLPLDWIEEDPARGLAADIPETVRLLTKPELAVQMLVRMWHAQIPISWVVADTVYGGNLDRRNWCEHHQYSYVLAVACTEPVGIVTADGQRRRVEVRDVEALLLDEQEWQRLSMSEGTKGPRLFDWAYVPILPRWEEDGRHFLLIRRSLTDPREKAYYVRLCPTRNHAARHGRGSWRTASISRKILPTPKIWVWTTTRCAALSAGTGTSPWCWWLWPIW